MFQAAAWKCKTDPPILFDATDGHTRNSGGKVLASCLIDANGYAYLIRMSLIWCIASRGMHRRMSPQFVSMLFTSHRYQRCGVNITMQYMQNMCVCVTVGDTTNYFNFILTIWMNLWLLYQAVSSCDCEHGKTECLEATTKLRTSNIKFAYILQWVCAIALWIQQHTQYYIQITKFMLMSHTIKWVTRMMLRCAVTANAICRATEQEKEKLFLCAYHLWHCSNKLDILRMMIIIIMHLYKYHTCIPYMYDRE